MPNVGISVPGILAPATMNGEMVNLLPYFNGCKPFCRFMILFDSQSMRVPMLTLTLGLKSSNRGGMPAYVNFLDDGGAAPLMMNKPSNTVGSAQ